MGARALIVSLLLAVAVAGCGGGSKRRAPASETGATTSAATSPKAAFIARGDAICGTVGAAIAAASARAGRAEQGDKVAVGREALGSEVTAAEGALRSLRALPEPAGSGPLLARLFSAAAGEIAALRRLAAAVGADDAAAALRANAALTAAHARYPLLAVAYGFTVCGAE